jgi:hypothetical protein
MQQDSGDSNNGARRADDAPPSAVRAAVPKSRRIIIDDDDDVGAHLLTVPLALPLPLDDVPLARADAIPPPVDIAGNGGVAIDGSCSDSSDPDDPVSRAARRAAIRAAEQSAANRPKKSSTIADYFPAISHVAYWQAVDIAAQPDPLDLRSVVPVSASDIVTIEDNDEYSSDSSSSGVAVSPENAQKRKYGYAIDGFVVNSSDSDGDADAETDV